MKLEIEIPGAIKVTLPDPAMIPGMKSPEELAPQAFELAQQKAEEEEVGIDQICVMASPFGQMTAIVLPER